ncbi:hypothetical protein V6N11_026427 [Hibiscus sabdariffa]|uniref:RNase H type-1 domain-containing protein n=1 Tax=Hibiscus sabdariffa TaxID=183260 RepID=A0ABR2SVP3_9ROSI
MDSSLDVIPLVGGSSVAVTSHAINNTPDTHRAISIQETSGADKGSRFDDRHVGRGKGIREVNPKGVRIRKAVGVNSPNRVLLSDWVQTTSHQIQAEVDSNRGRGDSGSIMEEDGREVISPRQVPRSDATFLGGMNFKDKGGGSGDLPLEWHDDPVTLQCMALEFFSSLFASIGVGTEPYHLRGLFPVLDVGTLQALSRDVVDDEIKEVRFWHDPWVSHGSVLVNHLLPGSFIVDETITVASMVDDYGQWRWELFEHMLPYSVLLRIAAVRVLARGSVPDRLCWGLTPTKQFKVCSAYEVRSPLHFGLDERVWSVIHRFKGSPQVRLFLWLLCHGRILTNEERVRRHFTVDGSCWFCGDVWEDIDHVFRRCPLSHSVWMLLVRADRAECFFALDFKQWLFLNLTNDGNFARVSLNWNMLFGSLFWCIWCRRNDGIFGTAATQSGSVLQRGLRMQQEAVAASVRGADGAGRVVTGAAVRWTKPQFGWHKLNSDGALDNRNGVASCGGLIRDDGGSWLIGFSKRIGICSVLEAELWGIYEGLLAAWTIGSRYLLVESDCLEAIKLVNNRRNSDGVLSMVLSIDEVLNRPWCVRFSHIARDGNHAADWMAKLASSDDLLCHRYLSPPIRSPKRSMSWSKSTPKINNNDNWLGSTAGPAYCLG